MRKPLHYHTHTGKATTYRGDGFAAQVDKDAAAFCLPPAVSLSLPTSWSSVKHRFNAPRDSRHESRGGESDGRGRQRPIRIPTFTFDGVRRFGPDLRPL